MDAIQIVSTVIGICVGACTIWSVISIPRKRRQEWRDQITAELNVRDRRIRVLEDENTKKIERLEAQENLNSVMLRCLFALMLDRMNPDGAKPELAEAYRALKNIFYKRSGTIRSGVPKHLDKD